MYRILSAVLMLGCVSGLAVFTDPVLVEQGRLRGLRSVSGQSRYYGIPYAVAERFQPPRDPPKWEGVFTAVDRFSSCAQTVSFLTLGREDCLQLDVYSPEDAHPADRLPVLVFIHGGGYYYGTKAHYDPEFLVTKRIVAVIVNYRVGVLGFLCLNGIANLGLKDQVAALRWVRKNIAAFGGDPDNVTLCGQSAGASAAAMHMLSPSSKGLFHKAILLSGSPLSPWAFNVEPEIPAFEDARKLGSVSSSEDVVKIFSQASIGDLLTATHDTSINTRYFKYAPCVESNASDPFFPGTPYDLLRSGRFNKVPIIVGFTDVEGMLFYGLHDQQSFKDFDENFRDKLPVIFSWCSEKDQLKISNKLRSHYYGSGPINSMRIQETVQYYSDWLAYSNIDAFSKLMSEVSDAPVYNYMFAYEGSRNFAKLVFGSQAGLRGASHSDDIFYIFKPAGLSLLLTTPDKLFIDKLTTMLTNFMRTGDPTPSPTRLVPVRWSPYSNTSLALRLARTLTLTALPDSHRGGFWLELLCAYGRKGYVPCQSTELCDRAPVT